MKFFHDDRPYFSVSKVAFIGISRPVIYLFFMNMLIGAELLKTYNSGTQPSPHIFSPPNANEYLSVIITATREIDAPTIFYSVKNNKSESANKTVLLLFCV